MHFLGVVGRKSRGAVPPPPLLLRRSGLAIDAERVLLRSEREVSQEEGETAISGGRGGGRRRETKMRVLAKVSPDFCLRSFVSPSDQAGLPLLQALPMGKVGREKSTYSTVVILQRCRTCTITL